MSEKVNWSDYTPVDQGASESVDWSQYEPVKPASAVRRLADTGLALAKGVVGVPEMAVGVADLATKGRAGKAVQDLGVRFKDAKDVLTGFQSDDQHIADAEVANAEGFLPTLGAMVRNPSTIVNAAVESAPSMFAGGVPARALMKVAPAIGPAVAGGLGEGVVAAGQNAEQVRQEDPNGTLTGRQAAIIAGSGLATGVIGAASGKVANALGIGDPNTMIAAGRMGASGADAVAKGAQKSAVRRIAEGALVEGGLEELPQSMQEQAAQNLAQDKPIGEGVGAAGAQGLLVGGLMGAGAGGLTSHGNPDQVTLDSPPAPGATPAPDLPTIDPNAGPISRAASMLADASGVISAPVDAPVEPAKDGQPQADSSAAPAADAVQPGTPASVDGGQSASSTPVPGPGAADPTRAESSGQSPTDSAPRAPDAQQPSQPAPASETAGPEVAARSKSKAPPEQTEAPGTASPGDLNQKPSEQASQPPAKAPIVPRETSTTKEKASAPETAEAIQGQTQRRQEPAAEGPASVDAGSTTAKPAAAAAVENPAQGTQSAGSSKALTVPQKLSVTFGGKTYPVESIEDAQRKWIKFQETADGGSPVGVSKVGNGVRITDQDGKFVARISFNGRVWDGEGDDAKVLAEAPQLGAKQEPAVIDTAAHEAATSPRNDLPEPTDAQKEKGNYKKGHVMVGGLDLSIENPAGSTRSGTDKSGKAWYNTLKHHYGYIKGTIGNDKDHVDAFVKPGTPTDYAGQVFVVDQIDPATGKFDEHKVIIGAKNGLEARQIYQANYAKGWKGAKAITPVPWADFKTWVKDGPKNQELAVEKAANDHVQAEFERLYQEDIKADIRRRLGLDPQPKAPAEPKAKTSAFRTFLRQYGIKPDHAADITGERGLKANNRLPATFRKNGRNLDELAQLAVERGFLTQADIESGSDNGGTNKLLEMIRGELRGESQVSNQQADDAAQDDMERVRRMEIEDVADKLGLPYEADISTDRLATMVQRVQSAIDRAKPNGLLKPDRVRRNAIAAAQRIEAKREQFEREMQEFASATIAEQNAFLDVLFDADGMPVIVRQLDMVIEEKWNDLNGQLEQENGQADTAENGASQEARAPDDAAAVERAGDAQESGSRAQRSDPAGQEAGLTAPTRADVLAQQDRAANAQALDDKAQIDKEAAGQTLTAPTAPEQRKDTSGDMFGLEKAQATIDQRNKGGTEPTGPSLFDAPVESDSIAPANPEQRDRNGLTAADRYATKIAGAAQDLASQIQGDFSEGDFDPAEVRPGLESFARDAGVPADELRQAVLKNLRASDMSKSNLRKVEKALDPTKVSGNTENANATPSGKIDDFGERLEGAKAITAMPMAEFKTWVYDGAKNKELAPEAQAMAKAVEDSKAALADLGNVLSASGRAHFVPEERQRILPTLAKLFGAAARVGYRKFKDAVKYVVEQIRKAFGSRAAESIDPADLQTAHARTMFARSESDQPAALESDGAPEFSFKAGKDGSVTVQGDAEAMRAMLPPGIIGRKTADGMQFSHTVAHRVRSALEGQNLTYSRAGKVVGRLPVKNGKYIGAPAKFDTPAKIPTLRKWLRKLADEGAPGRYWYENSSREVLKMVGGDVQEARRFVALLAIYSPQAKVDANSTFALRAWAQYKAGQPISVKTGVMDSKAKAALDDVDEFWSGEKTGNFFHNLLSEIDPATKGKQGATIDMWMMRAGRYDNDAPTATQYAFMENETNRLAAELGWEPQQVQAAIWVAMKARMENTGVKKDTEAKSERRKWIKYNYPIKNGKPIKTREILDAQKHRDNWLEHAFNHDPTKDDTQAAKFDFSDGVRRHIGQVSWEPRPSTKLPILPGIHSAPYAQQVEFQQAVQRALQDEAGNDMLAMRLGLLVDGQVAAPGIWEGDVSAGGQVQVAMAPEKGDDGKSQIDAQQKTLLDAYSAMLGLLLHQDGVGYHRPFFTTSRAKQNAVELRIGKPLTPEQAQEVWSAMDKRMRAAGVANWEQSAGMISSPDGIRVVNFGALEDNKAFRDLVADAVSDLTFDVQDFAEFASDGNLVGNNWLESSNGQDYQQVLSAAGRQDLLGWGRDVLAPRVQAVFEEYSRKYGWGDPGQASQGFTPAGPAQAVVRPRAKKGAGKTAFARSPYYSALTREVANIPAKSQQAGGWALNIAGLVKAGKVKQDEVNWTGVLDWLRLQEGKVTKEQVAQYLDANGVQVEETVLEEADNRQMDPDEIRSDLLTEYQGRDTAWLRTHYEAELDQAPPSGYSRNDLIADIVDAKMSYYESNPDDYSPAKTRAGATKYGQYQLPGGTNYREVLLTLPAKTSADPARAEYEAWAQRNGLTPNATMTEQRYERETGSAAPAPRTMSAMQADAAQNFKSSHWDQPNVLAHIRVNDRTDADGKKVLFVEEIQSDWGQSGKKQGFDTKADKAKRAELQAEHNRLQEEAFDLQRGKNYGDLTIEESGRLGKIRGRILQINDEMPTRGTPEAPFVTKTDAWLSLALKRIVKMAADGGYDRVAFVNGEQSADRYDLSKQVRSIVWTGRGNDTEKRVTITPNDGNDIEFMVQPDGAVGAMGRGSIGNEFDGKRLDDIVGKDVAERIMGDPYGDMRGNGLKVGGEGMKAFYDKIVPNTLKDVLKKLGGGTLETVSVPLDKNGWHISPPSSTVSGKWMVKSSDYNSKGLLFDTEAEAKAALAEKQGASAQPGFTLSDSILSKASEDLPQFSREGGAGVNMQDAKAIVAAVREALPTAPPIHILESINKAPKELKADIIKAGAQNDVDAAFHNGEIYVFPGNIASIERMAFVLAHHEIRHYGFRSMLGPKAGPIFLAIHATNANVRAAAAEQVAKGYAKSRVLAVEEALADMPVEDLATLNGFDRLIAALRDWLRSVAANLRRRGFAGLADAIDPKVWTDKDVAALIARAEGVSRGGAARYRTPGTVFAADVVPFQSGKPGGNPGGDVERFERLAQQVRDEYSASGSTMTFDQYKEKIEPIHEKLFEAQRRLRKWQEGRAAESIEDVFPGYQEIPIGTKIMAVHGIRFKEPTRATVIGRAGSRVGDKAWILPVVDFGDGNGRTILPGDIKEVFAGPKASSNSNTQFARGGTKAAKASWDAPEESQFDSMVYTLQDKQVDTKRVVESIRKASNTLSDQADVYLQEELFHGRTAKRTEDFVNRELKPAIEDMQARGITVEQLDQYLHARHAKEANELIAERNPDIQDAGSGMATADAQAYLAGLEPKQKSDIAAVAKKIDGIIKGTRDLYAAYGLESADTVSGWADMFQHYVPLMREDHDGSMGIGQGFSIKGKETKGRTGSANAKVVDILANIALQRERAIVRGEKNRVSNALVGLAQANPNPDFWSVGPPPPIQVYNPKTNQVEDRVDPLFKSRENVVVAKVLMPSGAVEERAVMFNESNERALRMAKALKNLDTAQMEGLLANSAKITRYFSAINTQYNPVFGVVNLVRDFQGAILNLSSTPLAGHSKEIARHTLSALKGVYLDARAARDGKAPTSSWAKLWEEFQDEGGQTGYRDLFRTSADRADAIKNELDPTKWMDSGLGKFFTAGGRLKVPLTVAQKGAQGLFGWLSDYNLAMENAVRLAAYKTALEQGMSKQRAASIGKNLTVNFNRKGQVGQQAGALYAFFNASMQGSARIAQTLFTMNGSDPRSIRLSSAGKKIVYGGILLGTMQAVLLAAAGFDDEEPPDFVRERSLVIPIGGKNYITIPMPLGLHILPNLGRIPTEFVLGGFKKPVDHIVKLLGLFIDAFNPVGGGASLVQTLSPTAIDPIVALAENRDWTGKPIARTGFNQATPGHKLTRDTASAPAKMLSEWINILSGGTEHVRGVFSPTPDQIDYLWGQVTGGVGREVNKIDQTVSSLVSGEDLPPYKVPLIGRFYGNSDSQSSQASSFYANLNAINEHEAEVKGRRKDGRGAEIGQYMAQNPQAKLIMAANAAERQVRKMRSEKRDMIARNAPASQVREKERQISVRMQAFNELVNRLEEQGAR